MASSPETTVEPWGARMGRLEAEADGECGAGLLARDPTAPAERREAQPVECNICDWKGRRLIARSKPCPACGARVNYR